MQNTDKSIFCIFCIYMHCPVCWWREDALPGATLPMDTTDSSVSAPLLQGPNTVLKLSRPWAVFGVTRRIDFNSLGFPGFKSCYSTSSTSAKVYAPPLQLQLAPLTLNEAHDRRCKSILEMDGSSSVKNVWSFAISLALWERSWRYCLPSSVMLLLEMLLSCCARPSCECIMPLKSKVRPMSRTMIVTVCDIWTGIRSHHPLESHPEAGAGIFIASNQICRDFLSGSTVRPHFQFLTQNAFAVYI